MAVGQMSHVQTLSAPYFMNPFSDSGIISHTYLDWFQSLKRFFINVSYHIHTCSQSNSGGSVLKQPSELDWLQVYDMTHWWKTVLMTGTSLMHTHFNEMICRASFSSWCDDGVTLGKTINHVTVSAAGVMVVLHCKTIFDVFFTVLVAGVMVMLHFTTIICDLCCSFSSWVDGCVTLHDNISCFMLQFQ